MLEIAVKTRSRTEFVDITSHVRSAVSSLAVENGVITVFIPHTTAAVTINENADPDVVSDMAKALDRIIPWSAGYAHAEGNSAAHVKASLTGSSVRVIVENGELKLGIWQSVYFCEFDGPRARKAWITV